MKTKRISKLEAAQEYLQRGCSVVPFQKKTEPSGKLSKTPCAWLLENGQLKIYKKRHPTDQELKRWFSSGNRMIAVITGEISNGFQALDFEAKDNAGKPMPCVYDQWHSQLKQFNPNLADKLVVATIISGGRHVYYFNDKPEKLGWLAKGKVAAC